MSIEKITDKNHLQTIFTQFSFLSIYLSGGILCVLSSMPHLDTSLGYETQYWFALVGQCFYGVTYTIIQNLTTELAESWFDGGERVLATSFLTIAFSFGLLLGQGLTPLFVLCPEQVYLLNIVWAIPTILFSIACLVTVRIFLYDFYQCM